MFFAWWHFLVIFCPVCSPILVEACSCACEISSVIFFNWFFTSNVFFFDWFSFLSFSVPVIVEIFSKEPIAIYNTSDQDALGTSNAFPCWDRPLTTSRDLQEKHRRRSCTTAKTALEMPEILKLNSGTGAKKTSLSLMPCHSCVWRKKNVPLRVRIVSGANLTSTSRSYPMSIDLVRSALASKGSVKYTC